MPNESLEKIRTVISYSLMDTYDQASRVFLGVRTISIPRTSPAMVPSCSPVLRQ
jgi:hypothetical protein